MTKPTTDPEAFILARIRGLRAIGRSWRSIAADVAAPGEKVNPGTVWKWAETGRAPQSPKVRRQLGLPIYGTVAYCPACGELPVQKRHSCPARTRKPSSARRVRFSERDTVAALKMTLDLVLGVMYGHVRPHSAAD
jgi:hypothetical protein